MTAHDRETEQVLEEHRRLRRDLTDLERLLREAPAAAGAGGWFDELLGQVRALRPRLERHFDLEIASGFFEQIERVWPNAAPKCLGCIRDHERLLAQVDSVLGLASARPAEEGSVRALVAETRLLIERLRDHENRETELFQTALEGGPAAID
jgi:hypothetical protein